MTHRTRCVHRTPHLLEGAPKRARKVHEQLKERQDSGRTLRPACRRWAPSRLAVGEALGDLGALISDR